MYEKVGESRTPGLLFRVVVKLRGPSRSKTTGRPWVVTLSPLSATRRLFDSTLS